MELFSSVADVVPDLASDRRSSLSSNQRVDASAQVSKRSLNVSALRVAGTQEGGVDGEQDPGAALEEQGREQNAEPKKNLESCNHAHG